MTLSASGRLPGALVALLAAAPPPIVARSGGGTPQGASRHPAGDVEGVPPGARARRARQRPTDMLRAGAMTESSTQQIELHGHPVTYRRVGEGPAVVLIHGITSSSRTWRDVLPLLAASGYTVIAPDLLGHGRSAKPRGDYSLGAYASGVRDLLVALEVPRATIVGHSLGGGVAMQFAYQFPERVERLVLVDSGGLGAEVSLVLRAATLPGAEYVLPLLASSPLRSAGAAVGAALGRVGMRPSADVRGLAEGFESLGDAAARRAFVHTARSVIDPAGQRVDASDRLYLSENVPSLIVWGEKDRMIPVRHGHDAHALMPSSRLETFPGAGHFPFNDDPKRFVALLHDFISTTDPAAFDDDLVRRLMLRHRS